MGIYFVVGTMKKMRSNAEVDKGYDRVLSRSAECTDEPFIFQYLVLKHRDHPSRIRLALAKTRDFCHRVMYDPMSSHIARQTSVENNCLSYP